MLLSPWLTLAYLMLLQVYEESRGEFLSYSSLSTNLNGIERIRTLLTRATEHGSAHQARDSVLYPGEAGAGAVSRRA